MDEPTDTVNDAPPRWSSVRASGPEAETFLQGQLSQDLARVIPDGAWALLLAPDGVVITSCYVTGSADGYALAVPRELGEVALTRLRRFLLRTKCTLDLVSLEHGPFDTWSDQITAGLPGPAEFAAGLTPQCFGASFVSSTVSFTKGCFTGQELVGRLDARGSSVPWRLVRATGPSAARLNEVLTSRGPAGVSGLTTSVRLDETVSGLGFAHRSLFGSEELALALDVHVEEIA
jgi:folate-binding Fe-S cluster repair protein YgfZ